MPIKGIIADEKWKIFASSFIVEPKTAVRELIDNSIDSGCQNIYVSIDSKTGGCEYISVRDDGPGVPQPDRKLMCLNNTTSKINSLDDLDKISTLGFRGEALFLIANLCCEVGTLEIITKCKDESVGEKWYIQKNGSIKPKSVRKAPATTGTVVTLRKLLGGFKSREIDQSSKARKTIEDLKTILYHYALNFRNIRFSFELVSLNKNGSIAQKQLQLSVAPNLTRPRLLSLIANLRKPTNINFVENASLEITDKIDIQLILPTMIPQSDAVNVKKSYEFLSVNNRALSRKLAFGKEFDRVLSSIYRRLQLLEPNVWYVNIISEPQLIDVNIEPEKDDILLKDETKVIQKMDNIIELYLREKLNINPTVSITNSPSFKQFAANTSVMLEHNESCDEPVDQSTMPILTPTSKNITEAILNSANGNNSEPRINYEADSTNMGFKSISEVNNTGISNSQTHNLPNDSSNSHFDNTTKLSHGINQDNLNSSDQVNTQQNTFRNSMTHVEHEYDARRENTKPKPYNSELASNAKDTVVQVKEEPNEPISSNFATIDKDKENTFEYPYNTHKSGLSDLGASNVHDVSNQTIRPQDMHVKRPHTSMNIAPVHKRVKTNEAKRKLRMFSEYTTRLTTNAIYKPNPQPTMSDFDQAPFKDRVLQYIKSKQFEEVDLEETSQGWQKLVKGK